MTVRGVAISGIVAGMYIALTVFLAPISYGPIQVRFAAGLCTLAGPYPFLILPLGMATGFANLMGGYGAWDVGGGAVATMAACTGCYLLRHWRWLSPIAIPLLSAPILAGYLHILFGLPFLWTMLYIGAGQTVAAYTVGVAVLKANDIYNRRNHGQENC